MNRITIKELFSKCKSGDEVLVKGWLRSNRKSKTFNFLALNDGTTQGVLQVIADHDIEGGEISKTAGTGSCVAIEGKLVESQGKGQSLEMQATKVSLLGSVDETYPLQKKATSLEFLREQAHLRPRTNLFSAVFRVRHHLAMATHKFFADKGFYYLNSPILTGVDAEGAGEMFNVSTLDLNNPPKLENGNIDFSKDYFGKQSSLCVTGQLEGECFASGMGAIYTFGPTFRSENSNTPRHLAEFWMIEPEVAFNELEDNAELAADYLKFLISYSMEHGQEELDAIMKWRNWQGIKDNHLETIKKVSESDFKVVSYTDAIDILNKSGKEFEFPTTWGSELQTEHERFLAEEYFKGPVTVTDYPKDFKAFYMKQNDDGKTVRAMDVLVPGVGEIIGGSQREDDFNKLTQRMDEMGMDQAPLWWYLDLRRFGSCPHSGFGLGFERAVMYVTGMKNIRDVIPFPRTPRNCDF